MTRLTAILIAGNDTVYASSYGPVDGKFGLYIGMTEETPSGFQRKRDLLSSNPVYLTAKAAKEAAEKIITEVRGAEGES